ncbi:MAG: copper-binding protein [Pseudomonadota bacterium]
MKSLSNLYLAAAIVLSSAPMAFAQNKDHPAGASSAAAAPMTAGEIRKVDKDAGKITIRHAELKALEMPAMTMVFRVSEPAMLDRVKAGDKINFIADKIGGQLTVTALEKAK